MEISLANIYKKLKKKIRNSFINFISRKRQLIISIDKKEFLTLFGHFICFIYIDSPIFKYMYIEKG